MMCNLSFSRYKLFNYKNVHIVKPNVLRLNKDYFPAMTQINLVIGEVCHTIHYGDTVH